jgi:hypothetical protein
MPVYRAIGLYNGGWLLKQNSIRLSIGYLALSGYVEIRAIHHYRDPLILKGDENVFQFIAI